MLQVHLKDGRVEVVDRTDGGGIQLDDPRGYEVGFLRGDDLVEFYQVDIDRVVDTDTGEVTHEWGNPHFPGHPLSQ